MLPSVAYGQTIPQGSPATLRRVCQDVHIAVAAIPGMTRSLRSVFGGDIDAGLGFQALPDCYNHAVEGNVTWDLAGEQPMLYWRAGVAGPVLVHELTHVLQGRLSGPEIRVIETHVMEVDAVEGLPAEALIGAVGSTVATLAILGGADERALRAALERITRVRVVGPGALARREEQIVGELAHARWAGVRARIEEPGDGRNILARETGWANRVRLQLRLEAMAYAVSQHCERGHVSEFLIAAYGARRQGAPSVGPPGVGGTGDGPER
jgi:hypothetical protein